MRKTILSLCSLGLVLSGCGSSGGGGSGPGNSAGAVAANSCVASNPNGPPQVSQINPASLVSSDEDIYSVGQLPNNNQAISLGNPGLRAQIVQSSIGQVWQIGRDGDGDTLRLKIWKDVVSQNGQVYQVDEKTFNEGEPINFTDPDLGVNIQCNIPSGWNHDPDGGNGDHRHGHHER